MTPADTLQLAFRNLGQAKLRTALTTMGVSIGIASLAGMVSLGVGLQDQTVGRFMKSGVFDAITVMPMQTRGIGFLGRGSTGRRGPSGGGRDGQRSGNAALSSSDKPNPGLDDEALKKIGSLPLVKTVYPNLRVPVELTYGQFSEFSVAAGVPMSSQGEGAFQTLAFGTFFRNESDDACLLTLDMAKRITDHEPRDLIGQTVTLSYATTPASGTGLASVLGVTSIQRVDAKYTVVGIVEREPAPGLGVAGLSGLMIPLAKARDIGSNDANNAQAFLRAATGAKGPYSSATVKVTRAQSTQDVEDQIKAMGYSAFSLADALQGAKRAFIILDIVLSLIGSIALAVSSLGIVNTMVMSILERTREIGIMKAIGGSDSDIRRIFLIEASTIGLLGGVAGVVLGWAVGRIINLGANIYIRSQGGTAVDLFSLPFWLISGAIAFSIAVSLIAGSYPASRAARLDPIQALRHD
jgi:putative ABC transport system permease protein